ncbi:hypothetical protein B0T25DRAFT_69838 [Lasiosphaeria hispida]|uniref:C2H2-type domain-containing protein n=1 Tax=Lasiosphaeria hispida TaxID=260671 RepID=A0AAJ0HXX7_9PEZI|nr:hypothetical protein B0T25DRAFT_69838 [Lasiosphaeria hispida]
MDARQGTLHAATTKDTSKEESTDGEISLLVVKCLQSFGQILPLSDQPIFSTLRDEETRFKVWSGNIGAHKKGRSSLDYRLRDASHLQKQVLNLLADLAALIEDATAIVDGDKVPWDQLEEDSLTGDDGDEDGDEGIPETELGQIATDVVEVVDCLLRLSVTIRNPAPHDRFVASAATETLHYEPYDTQHVRSKFGDTVNEALAKRLGEAISRRRQYFKYRESHHTKLSSSLDSDAKDAASTVASSIPHHMKDSATNNTQPMVGVVDEDARSDAGASETSFASSAASDAKLRVPPLPQQAQKGPFECPFCFMMIAATNTISWKRHVYGDLRPYTCLSEDCQTPEHEFSRRQEWMEHEIQNHWRKFCCPCGCEETFASASACKAHVRSNHLAEVSTGQLDALVDLSARPLKVEDGMACRLCGETLFSLKQYRRHVGRHQEQLSLFALPSLGQGTEDEDESEATEDSGHENEVFEEDSGGGADSGTKRGQASADSEVMWDIVVEQTYYASDDEQPEPEQIHPDHPLLQASSYWSVSESTDFPLLLRSFGTDWSSIAAHMQTKTPVMELLPPEYGRR